MLLHFLFAAVASSCLSYDWKAQVGCIFHSSCSFRDFHASFMDLHSAMTFTVWLCSAGCDVNVGFWSICPGASGDYFKHFSDLFYTMASKPAIASQLRGSKFQHSIATLVHGCYEERKEPLNPASHCSKHTGLTCFPAEIPSIRHCTVRVLDFLLIGHYLEVQWVRNVVHTYSNL